MIKRHLRHLAFVLAAVATIAGSVVFAQAPPPKAGKPQTGLPTITLKIGTHAVKADIANTNTTREIGLMFKQKMGANEGMLFVFPEIAYHAMWMRNTLIPLSVAYMNERGVILSIHEMQALTEVPHQAAGPARYALEMNAGWFSANKVSVGETIKGLDKAPKPQ